MISPSFLQACMAGEEEAIQTLVRGYQRPVFLLALSILDDGEGPDTTPETVEEAEAAAQQTFLLALDRLGRYREDMPFETWLYRIAIEAARKRARLIRARNGARRLLTGLSRQKAPVEAAAPEPVTASPVASADDEVLWQSVRKLEEKLRLPVVLRYYHDFPVEQIAKMLKLSEGAVSARLDAAREKIAGGK